MHIDHIAIWTNDLEKVKDFYLKYFDCTSNDRYVNIKKQFYSYFLTFSDGMRIELMKQSVINIKDTNITLGLTHIALNVGTKDKVDKLTNKLDSDGYIIDSYPRVTGDGYYESVVLDPEGNKLELTAINEYLITKASHNDLEQILHLQKCCYLSEAEIYNNYSIQPLTQTLTDIQNEFEHQTILKLEYKNNIIGSVRAYMQNGICFIGKLIVDKDYQNMGFGKQLLVEIEKQFDNVEKFELFTGTRSEKNLYLYQKCGYKEFKEEKINGITIKYLEKLQTNSNS